MFIHLNNLYTNFKPFSMDEITYAGKINLPAETEYDIIMTQAMMVNSLTQFILGFWVLREDKHDVI